MELYACDENVMHKIHEAEAKSSPSILAAMPDNALLKNIHAASSFEPVNLGFTTIPPIAQMNGDIAVVKVSGALVAGSAGFRRLFGLIGYEDVKAAVMEAVMRQDVAGILMYYDTPGGQISTLQPSAEFIKGATKYKPVASFAVQAASAGYWLASGTGKIYADGMSVIGSIGTVIQMVSYKKAQEGMGLEYNVFKSGELKMAGNPNEQLSEKAKAYFQGMVEDMTAMFYQTVSENRGRSREKLWKDFGDGRAMLGPRALAGGLIDSVGGIDAAMKDLRRQITAKQKK